MDSITGRMWRLEVRDSSMRFPPRRLQDGGRGDPGSPPGAGEGGRPCRLRVHDRRVPEPDRQGADPHPPE